MTIKTSKFVASERGVFLRRIKFWSIAIFLIKLVIIFNIPSGYAGSTNRIYLIDGIWLGADGENYLLGYNSLLSEGIFSPEGILNFWPAGYPIFILFLSILGEGWVLTTLSITQSLIFSFAVYIFIKEIHRTRLSKFALLAFFLILINPTLSLSSITVGYESLTASGFLIATALVVKDISQKNEDMFKFYVLINSIIFGLMAFLQPRLVLAGMIIILIWVLSRRKIKSSVLTIVLSLVVTLFFPATLVFRNNQSVGLNSISTNLGVTMNIGAGDNATGGYIENGYGVPCQLSGSLVEQDNQRVKCVLAWYLSNPSKATKLFFNKSIYFWSPWFGPIASGTMARNPWLKISPLADIAKNPEGLSIISGSLGKVISWLWLLGGLAFIGFGFTFLWRQRSIERLIGVMALVIISTNWLISLISIGDHRFRIPVMGMSLFLQAIGIRALFSFGKPLIVQDSRVR